MEEHDWDNMGEEKRKKMEREYDEWSKGKRVPKKTKGNNISVTLCYKRPRALMSMGFAEFEKRNRKVEIISASKKWIRYIKSWKKSFDADIGDLTKLNIYKARPHLFDNVEIVGSLWGAIVIKQNYEFLGQQHPNSCRLASHGGGKLNGVLCTLILDQKKEAKDKKEEKKNG